MGQRAEGGGRADLLVRSATWIRYEPFYNTSGLSMTIKSLSGDILCNITDLDGNKPRGVSKYVVQIK